MKIEQIQGPTEWPITRDELSRGVWEVYEREVDDQTLFDQLIKRATAYVETATERVLMPQTWRGYLQAWPNCGERFIRLPLGRAQAVSKVLWLEADGTDHELVKDTDFIVSLVGDRPAIFPPATGWPSGQLFSVDPIRVEWTAGFKDADSIPEDLKQAIILIAAHWYKNREIERIGNIVSPLSHTFDALVTPWKLLRF